MRPIGARESEGYLGISVEDRCEAAEAWMLVAGGVDAILDRFYADTGDWRFLPPLGRDQVDRLKQGQIEHWERLFSAPADADFERRGRLIGLRHRQYGVPPAVFVLAYMKMLGMFFDELRAATADGRRAALLRCHGPMARLVGLDMGYTLSAYGAEVLD